MKAVLAELERRKAASQTAAKAKRKQKHFTGERIGKRTVVTVNGEKYTFEQLSIQHGIKVATLKDRYMKGRRDDDLIAKVRPPVTYPVGDRLMTVTEIADMACVATRTVFSWLKNGEDILEKTRASLEKA